MDNHFVRRALPEPISFATRDAPGDGLVVSGYVTKTGVSYEPYRGYELSESIAAGAFDTLDEDNTKFLIQHEGLALASVGSGTMTVKEDKTGVRFEAKLQADDPDALRLASKVRAGVIDSSSVGMYVRKYEYDKEGRHQTITSAELFEISAVSFAAQPAATIQEGRDQAVDLLIRRLSALDAPDPRAPIPEGFDFEELVERVRSTIVETLTSRNLTVVTKELVEQPPPFDPSGYLQRLDALS